MNSIIDLKLEDEGIKDLLKRLQKRLLNLRAPMDSIGQLILTSVEKNFDVGGRYSGASGDVMGGMVKWDRLSPSTVKRRYRERTWPGKILQVSGRLAASIHAKASKDSVIVDTNTEYAAMHQFGGTIQMKGKSGKLRLRTTAKGELLRQGKEGILRHLAVFAKADHKRAVEREYTTKDYKVTIPARPFLVVQREDLTEIRATILNHLTRTD